MFLLQNSYYFSNLFYSL